MNLLRDEELINRYRPGYNAITVETKLEIPQRISPLEQGISKIFEDLASVFSEKRGTLEQTLYLQTVEIVFSCSGKEKTRHVNIFIDMSRHDLTGTFSIMNAESNRISKNYDSMMAYRPNNLETFEKKVFSNVRDFLGIDLYGDCSVKICHSEFVVGAIVGFPNINGNYDHQIVEVGKGDKKQKVFAFYEPGYHRYLRNKIPEEAFRLLK